MAVYTEVSPDEARHLLNDLRLGQLQSMEPCKGGIENTNYFVTTDQGAYVLTLFERLSAQQLPFYLKRKKWKLILSHKTFASTCFVHPDMADRV